jgi:hypothetical protein
MSAIDANVDEMFVDRTTRVTVVADAVHTESDDKARSTTGPATVAAVVHALFTSTNSAVVFVVELNTATATVEPSDATCCATPVGRAGPNAVGPGAIENNPQLDATIVPNAPAFTAEVNVPNLAEVTVHVPVTLVCNVDTVPAASCRTADGCTIRVFEPSEDRSTPPTTVAVASEPSTLAAPATAFNVLTEPGVNSVGPAATGAATAALAAVATTAVATVVAIAS